MLDPRSAATVGAVATHIARRGTLNMVGETALDGLVDTDVGRLHYDYTAYLGGRGPDIADSYGEARNRADLRSGGTTVFVGAGGPMGLMHVQRAIQQADGPRTIVATEVSDERLKSLEDRLAHLAEANDCELLTFNSQTSEQSLRDFVLGITDGKGADDVVVSVPIAGVMAEADTLMNADGMLVFFAGVPNGTLAPLNLSAVYLANAQYTGTSGLTIHDQQQVVDLADAGRALPGIHRGRGRRHAGGQGRPAGPRRRHLLGQGPDLPADPRPAPHGARPAQGHAARRRGEARAGRHLERRGGEGVLRQPAGPLARSTART